MVQEQTFFFGERGIVIFESLCQEIFIKAEWQYLDRYISSRQVCRKFPAQKMCVGTGQHDVESAPMQFVYKEFPLGQILYLIEEYIFYITINSKDVTQ